MAGSMRGRRGLRGRLAARAAPVLARVLADLPAALLVVVALHQIHLARTAHLNPWKGGGFGMFATTDHASARRVRALALTGDGGSTRLAIPPDLGREVLRVRHLPVEAERLARRLARRAARGAIPAPPATEAVRVEVWRIEIDLDAGVKRERRLHQAVAVLAPPGPEARP